MYIAALAHYYGCMHEGGRCLSMGSFGGGGGGQFPPFVSSKFASNTSTVQHYRPLLQTVRPNPPLLSIFS